MATSQQPGLSSYAPSADEILLAPLHKSSSELDRHLHGHRVEARAITLGMTLHERLDLVRLGHLKVPLRDFSTA